MKGLTTSSFIAWQAKIPEQQQQETGGSGERRGGRGGRGESERNGRHVHSHDVNDVRGSLHVGHKQRLLEPISCSGLDQLRRVSPGLYTLNIPLFCSLFLVLT